MKSFKIVSISDTHGKHRELTIPPCDILIHAGDATFYGEPHELKDFAIWLNEQEAGHIVVTFGNHEAWAEKNLEEARRIMKQYCPAINLLINESVNIEGVTIFASPATPFFFNWAWNYARTNEEAMFRNIEHIQHIWNKIPAHTNILVTHGPPYKVLDQTPRGEHVGDYNLLGTLMDLAVDLHFFGHIHHSHGKEERDDITFYNVAICNEQYLPVNPITVVDYLFEE